jgi:hypothetical protein
MPTVDIDMHEVRDLAADFSQIPGELARHAIPVVEKAAMNVKKQLLAEMRASKHFKGFARISYDISSFQGFGGGEIVAEIGPDKDGPGAGANIAYFGTYKGGGTVPDPRGALEAEYPNLEKHLADLAEELFG